MLLRQMDLEKRRLEHILRHLGAAEVAAEVTEQFLLVSVDERLEGGFVTVAAEPPQQFLVGRPFASASVISGQPRRPTDRLAGRFDAPPLPAHRGRSPVAPAEGEIAGTAVATGT